MYKILTVTIFFMFLVMRSLNTHWKEDNTKHIQNNNSRGPRRAHNNNHYVIREIFKTKSNL